MELQRILFISIISITTFALSLLTARIYAIGLKSGASGARIATLVGVLFPLIFIGANILGRYSNGLIARLVTIFSDTLGGFALYALITSIVLGIVLFICTQSGYIVPKNVSVVFLGITFLLGLTGLIQAKMLKIVPYTITLTGAPESWNGKTAVLFSDTHYGLVNHKNFSRKITTKILEINPDFVMHAGDLYDGPAVETASLTKDWARLTEKFPVFFAPGNHEEYGPYSDFLQSAKDAGFVVLDDKKTIYEGVQIAGITYRDKRNEKNATDALRALDLDTALPTILINHPPTFQKGALENSVDLMVSGHTHRGQLWPIRYIVRAIYGKYIYGVNVDDTLTTITTSGVGTAGPPMRLFNTPELVRITFKTQ